MMLFTMVVPSRWFTAAAVGVGGVSGASKGRGWVTAM
jgi:hypothetical protein